MNHHVSATLETAAARCGCGAEDLARFSRHLDALPLFQAARINPYAFAEDAGLNADLALDLFVHVLGGVIGNMALKVMASGGLYLGGGLPPRILSRLQRRDFLDAVCYKGRFRDWLTRIPVYVILDPNVALHGAAWDALETAGE